MVITEIYPFIFSMLGIIIGDYGAVVRAGKDKMSKYIGELECFDIVDILEKGNDWVKVSNGKTQGYIPRDYMEYL